MDKVMIESSSDEDDTYINPAARLRALKRKRIENEKLNKPASVAVANNTDDVPNNTDDVTFVSTEMVPNNIIDEAEEDVQTGIRITRSRSRGPFNDTLEVEFVPLEDRANPVSDCTKDDIVSLSSDDDKEACEEDENYEMNIKVLWRSTRLDRLSMRRHDSFLKIFQHYADLEKVSVNEILITRNDKVISHIDTPALLNLSVIDILDGGIVNPGMNTVSCKDKDDDENDACSIKVQTANRKQSLTVPLKNNQQFRMLFSYCAMQLGENESNLKFYFDGEQISPIDTPESLDMEGEACIDLRISSV